MNTMQAFYEQLTHAAERVEPLLTALAQLTQTHLADLAVLQSDLDWGQWDGQPAAA